MTECVFSPRSRRDLDEIYDYIADENLDAAEKFIERIEDTCQLLALRRKIGKDRSDLRSGLWRFRLADTSSFTTSGAPASKSHM